MRESSPSSIFLPSSWSNIVMVTVHLSDFLSPLGPKAQVVSPLVSPRGFALSVDLEQEKHHGKADGWGGFSPVLQVL